VTGNLEKFWELNKASVSLHQRLGGENGEEIDELALVLLLLCLHDKE
jgi:hypothetical protein